MGADLVRGALEAVVPNGVVVRVVPIGPDESAAVRHEDAVYAAVVATMGGRRRAEFLAGRAAAHDGLDALGCPTERILVGADRVPRWPEGILGSISHDALWAVAVVASSTTVRAIGVDIEPAEPLPDDTVDTIVQPHDRLAPAFPDRAVLCVKEAAFKCWFPAFGRWLEHDDVTVTIDDDGSTTAAVMNGDPLPQLLGSIVVADATLLAAAWLPA
jgi:4'-phosphopantetheinyl transferase EntD